MIKRVFLDLLFYLGIPLLLWNVFREDLGDYTTILVGMVPAVVYTVVMLIIKKEWNVTGIFFLSIISLNWILNLFSNTAEQELWNGVYMSVISIAFYALTLLVKRPIGMYFFVDYAHAKGVPRKESFAKYKSKENFHHFVNFTLFLGLREILQGGIKSYLIITKGVEGFNHIQIITTVLGYTFTAIMIFYVMYILKKIKTEKKSEK